MWPKIQARTVGGYPRNISLTLFGGSGLKGGNELLHFPPFAFRTAEFLLFVFGHRNGQRKLLFTLLTHELVCGHGKPPALC